MLVRSDGQQEVVTVQIVFRKPLERDGAAVGECQDDAVVGLLEVQITEPPDAGPRQLDDIPPARSPR